MNDAPDYCSMPISEINKMTDEIQNLRSTIADLLDSGKFASYAIMQIPYTSDQVHPESICVVNLRMALRVREAVSPTPSVV